MARNIVPADELLEQGIAFFKKEYSGLPEVAGIAPGRVNLIGEHTDYNEGFVFPMALPMVTVVLGKRTDSNRCHVMTANAGTSSKEVVFPVPTDEQPLEAGEPSWANYIKGVVQYFEGPKVGFNAVIVSSVPLGSGLSSSASLEVAMYTFLEALAGTKADLKKKALICQKAEHVFASTPCGLMDQLIAVYGQKNAATFIDCRTLEPFNVDIPKSDSVFLIINSKVSHNLGSSEYPVRRQSCETVAKKLNKKSLRDATIAEIKDLKEKNQIDEILYKRAYHVIKENERTKNAVNALCEGDLQKFGQLMNESHDSLSKDYEVSCAELDTLVKIARGVKGVIGSRMTGGGFGGCTVTLVEKSAVNELIEKVEANYTKKADIYIVTASDGAVQKLL